MSNISKIPTNWQNGLLTTFRFWVEVEGIYVGGFTEISGLQAETEYEQVMEGGVNDYIHLLPKRTKFPPLVFKRGMSDSSFLWDWYETTIVGDIQRKSGSVVMFNAEGEEVCAWSFQEGYPVKWIGPTLNASQGSVAVEAIEIVHKGLFMDFS